MQALQFNCSANIDPGNFFANAPHELRFPLFRLYQFADDQIQSSDMDGLTKTLVSRAALAEDHSIMDRLRVELAIANQQSDRAAQVLEY